MIKSFLLLALLTAGILATSCGNRSQKTSGDFSAIGDTSRNALDWEGTYYGVLPCAGCEGIETVITIRYDETYIIKTKYLGKDDQVFDEKGTFTWNELGNIITLDQPIGQKYLVGENQLFHLDQNGQRITGDLAEHYRLPMVTSDYLEETPERIELKDAEGAAGEKPNQ